jgi:hypothetical protein
MIPIRNKKTDISSDVAAGKSLQKKIKALADEASKKSLQENLELDEVIAQISKREGFNRLQIQRLIEEGNTVTYNKRYEKLRNSNDRRITFSIASLDGVMKEMGESAPPEIKNPNLSSGKQGGGEMSKAASEIETSYIHHPNARLQERSEKYFQKIASVKQKQQEKERMIKEREQASSIFKIANSLVMSERKYKNGNEIFNTMLSDVSLSEETTDQIIKKASAISEQMVKTKRSPSGFMVTLKENSTEKIANHLLGEYSLLKEAEQLPKVKEVKVQPTGDISNYQQLIDLARNLEKQQKDVTNKPV